MKLVSLAKLLNCCLANTSFDCMSGSSIKIHGYACRLIRELKGRAVGDLARALQVDRSYITRIELGYATSVSSVFYARLLRELGISDHRVLMANPPGRADSARHGAAGRSEAV
jgi:transcriptional regulator with XRE-family HTH domain